eukprot:TRINITY_DN982_c0_g1_i1.p1 TRINITY_DN982_c0_g1~~TRINITY_DN982_c0_g1_i1.p1  ORF type:complete len:489 (-),score=113.63 TRINITY_DN982_c0_g1_i1:1314-2780(-)
MNRLLCRRPISRLSSLSSFTPRRLFSDVNHYDLIVLGGGPAAMIAATTAAHLKKKVALADGVGGNRMGSIPTKSLREAIMYFSGYYERAFYGRSYEIKEGLNFADLLFRVQMVVQRENEAHAALLRRHGIKKLLGNVEFVDPKTIRVSDTSKGSYYHVQGENILIDCGYRPRADPTIVPDGNLIVNINQFFELKELPKSIMVVGAGVLGLEMACMLSSSRLMDVTVVDERTDILSFADNEIVATFMHLMRANKVKFRLGEKVSSVSKDKDRGKITANLQSGKKVTVNVIIDAGGRVWNTDLLKVQNAGITPDYKGQLRVNESYQTEVPYIYAAGDVTGSPGQISSSTQQGRIAALHMFGLPWPRFNPEFVPFGIHTIPEMSMIGKNEQQLTELQVPYEYGVANYLELAKGVMRGDEVGGILKILFHRESRKLLGVHCIGENATELIHIGQVALSQGQTINYLTSVVYNHPTFAEIYQTAALDGLNKIN